MLDISFAARPSRSEEHTSELQSRHYLVCRLLLEKKKNARVTLQLRVGIYTDIYELQIALVAGTRGFDLRPLCLIDRSRTNSRFARFFFLNDTATSEIYTLTLHDALPI